jgi:Family of unknown function (DUF6263)
MASRLKTAALILCILNTGSIARSTDPIHLRFRPEIGDKRTVCVTWRLTSWYDTMGHQDRMEYIRAWTVDLEPVALDDDGGATIRVGIRRIQEKATMVAGDQTHPMMQFDSAENKHEDNESLARSAAFLHLTFNAKFSAQGRLVDMDTDDFYARVAENRVLFENEAIRSRPQRARAAREHLSRLAKEKGLRIPMRRPKPVDPEDVIWKRADKYGSRLKRQQTYEKEAPKSNLYGTAVLERVMNYLTAPLAAEPLRPRDRWTAPAMIYVEGPVEMDATHTLQEIDNDLCTIPAQAYRTPDDGPITDEMGHVHKGVNLKGTYIATMTVNRTTGELLHKKAVMDLIGTVRQPGPPSNKPRPDIPTNIQVTVTVEPVK